MEPIRLGAESPFVMKKLITKSLVYGKECVVARTPIPAGTLILAEKPLFITKKDILKEDFSVPREIRLIQEIGSSYALTEIDKLWNRYADISPTTDQAVTASTPFMGKVKTRATPLSLDQFSASKDYIGIFATISSINHSCHPNSMQSWDGNLELIYATRDIAKGEEITVSYVPEARIDREYLWKVYWFRCVCNWCSIPENDRQASDMNRIKIEQLTDEMEAKATGDAQTTLRLVKAITELMKVEQIHDFRFARVLTGAFLFMEGKHDKERAGIFLSMAINAWIRCKGKACHKVQMLMPRVTRYGGSMAAIERLTEERGANWLFNNLSATVEDFDEDADENTFEDR